MSPRRAKLGADLFTAAVVASVGIALAGLTWRLLGDPGQRLAAAPVAVRAAPPPDIATLVGLSPFGDAAPTSASADANVVLRGILLATPRSASSALVSIGGATPIAFYAGGQVAGGTIVAIEGDHVVLAVGGERRMLAFPDRGGGVPANAAATPPMAPISPVASQPAPPPAPSTASAQSVLAGLGGTPGADGFHIAAPSPQMRMAGLLPGDVVQRVNGMAMGDLMMNPGALQTAIINGTARVDLVRAGQPLTLSVPLR